MRQTFRATRPSRSGPKALIIVQNLPVPLDRRVWLESQALTADGVRVTVICPLAEGLPWHEEIDGIAVYRYPAPPVATNAFGFLREFVHCWLLTAVLSVLVKIREGFDVIQACNPPDTYWLLARLWRVAGVRFVYDQHDLNPEVLLSRFGRPSRWVERLQLRFLLWLERHSYWAADEVVVTNGSYRDVAVLRGVLDPAKVTIVRSGPDSTAMRAATPDPSTRQGHRYLAVYLGVMGPQDGVHNVLLALDEIVNRRGRTDCAVALLGFGDCYDELVALTAELRLQDHVTFTGRVGAAQITRYLSSAALGLGPDPHSPLNNVSTMNKTMEYMAYGLPVVSFDLVETRVSAGGAGVFVQTGDIAAFADAWCALLDDAERRERLGRLGRERVVHALDWSIQAARYISVYRRVLGHKTPLDDTGRVDEHGIGLLTAVPTAGTPDDVTVGVGVTDHPGHPEHPEHPDHGAATPATSTATAAPANATAANGTTTAATPAVAVDGLLDHAENAPVVTRFSALLPPHGGWRGAGVPAVEEPDPAATR